MDRIEGMREEDLRWYCFRTQPKKERIASVLARERVQVECFCPQISYIKKTKRGKVRFHEAMFPGYLFVRCDPEEHLRHLLSVQGVSGVVRYGDRMPILPEGAIVEIRKFVDDKEEYEVPEPGLKPGDEVEILEGPFKHLNAIFTGQSSGAQRVQILLEILGQEIKVEVSEANILPKEYDPKSNIRDQLL